MRLRRFALVLLPAWLALASGTVPAARAADVQDLLPGARARALGAYAAVGDDMPMLFYNPAGLADKANVEADADVSRIVSDGGPVSSVLLGYSRPVPIIPGGTASAAYYGIRQPLVGDKDTVALSWGLTSRMPNLQRPLKWGVTAKFIDFRTPSKSRFGLGADGGVLLETNDGFKTGVSVVDLTTDVGLPTPSLVIGSSKALGRWLFACDLRWRSGLMALYPGVEGTFYSGFLKVRAGKGVTWDDHGNLSLGLGFDLSPLTVDVQANVPWKGLTEPFSGVSVTMGYRFGAPLFYNRMVGRSSEEATRLQAELNKLQSDKAKLADDLEAARVNKGVLETELRSVEARLEQAKREYRETPSAPPAVAPEAVPAPRLRPKPVVKKPEPKTWPQKHPVAEGDTLRSIAGQYYGDPSQWELIYNANPDKIERGLPRVGSELSIPEPRK